MKVFIIILIVTNWATWKFGGDHAFHDGYKTGHKHGEYVALNSDQCRLSLEESMKPDIELRKKLQRCIKEHDEVVEKANAQIKDLLDRERDETERNLYPETVKAKEPTQFDREVDDYNSGASTFNPITREYEDN